MATARRCISEHEALTFAEYDGRANRYARWAMANGVVKGDVVCLLMANRPEYAAIWLGIVRVGGVVALLNTNLRGSALAHCVNLVRPKHVIVASDLAEPHYDSAERLIAPGSDGMAARRAVSATCPGSTRR